MSATVAPAPVKRVVTQAMIDANRQNSLKSTGPRTAEGKQRCSQNSITHGIFAKNMALNEEEQDLYEQFRLDMLVEMNPANYQEMRCAEVVVNCYWKLRRCDAAEMRLLNRATHNLGILKHPNSDTALAHAIANERQYGIARLSTYHQRLLNQIHKAMRELRQLRKESIVPGNQRAVDELTPFLRDQLIGEGIEWEDDEPEQEQHNLKEPQVQETSSSESRKAEPCAALNPGPATGNDSNRAAADAPMKIEPGTQASEEPPDYRKCA